VKRASASGFILPVVRIKRFSALVGRGTIEDGWLGGRRGVKRGKKNSNK